jgi:hypothetical protein
MKFVFCSHMLLMVDVIVPARFHRTGQKGLGGRRTSWRMYRGAGLQNVTGKADGPLRNRRLVG